MADRMKDFDRWGDFVVYGLPSYVPISAMARPVFDGS